MTTTTRRARDDGRGGAKTTRKKSRARESDAGGTWDARRDADARALGALALAPAAAAAASAARASDAGARACVASAAIVSWGAYALTMRLLPTVGAKTLARNMSGYDLNKKGTALGERRVPESGGLAAGCAYAVALTMQQLCQRGIRWWFGQSASGTNAWALEQNSALACVGFMIFLGFVDDVLDLPWRVKIVMPGFAALPLLLSYSGGTTVLIPSPVRALLELPAGVRSIDVGPLYLCYMWLLVVFCSNSINIHAGLNGLEAGQSLIIAGAILLLNVLSLANDPSTEPVTAGAHLFSIFLTLPFFATTLALLRHNWYPSKIFVGDTYTYFAGMTLGVVGTLGHFSETLLLFFLPQVLNFVYSTPQLFKIVHCPRHRLPIFDPKTGLLHPSMATETRYNMNLVTLFLRLFGPCTERVLCARLLAFQFLSCAFAFVARHALTGVWK
jgi:UDP-N-acetylglucosamine--dolichyl-phosphate N-acetylglucosaminephosphotransferase|tara:strand:- start:13136 stop:14470 length:1335 start_codon:yes stop_codon:yes gene_type:complete